jgi:lipid A disaccharide synthetase
MVETAPAPPIDILILSNGPGELVTWVKPVVRSLRQALGNDRRQLRISVVLSPCPNASGAEGTIAASYPEVDRVQVAADFFPFLFWGRTRDSWDWRSRGIVVFLGGDEIFPVVIGKRLGFRTVVYSEWEALWPRFVDRYAVMNAAIVAAVKPKYRGKFTIVGDLMVEAGGDRDTGVIEPTDPKHHTTIGLLPGSKAAKLMQGVPLFLAVAELISQVHPQIRFVVPVAPGVAIADLARYADVATNPTMKLVDGVAGRLILGEPPYLETARGVKVALYQNEAKQGRIPPYKLLKQCQLCLTTVGANTAELGALTIPMIVVLPTNQLDAMRAWNGLPGILANLPGVGSLFAKTINWYFLRKVGLLAWPNIWAGREIVPEMVGHLTPSLIADRALDYLAHPEQLATMRQNLHLVRGEAGAADRLAAIVVDMLRLDHPSSPNNGL